MRKPDTNYVISATTIKEISRRIRELGTSLAPSLRQAYNDHPEYALDAICQYETDSQYVAACQTLRQARAYLKSAGYGELA